MKKFILLLFLFAGNGFLANATHIIGGFIAYKQLERNVYEFSAHIFFDRAGVPIDQEVEMSVNGVLKNVKLGKTEMFNPSSPLAERTIKGIYSTTYTLDNEGIPFLSGAFYRIGVRIRNRNPNTANIPNSVNVPFYIESLLSVSQSNNSVVFEDKNVAIFAKVGSPLQLNNIVKDPDNDQITFAIDAPFRDVATRIEGYSTPDRTACNNCTLSINANSGELIWQTPSQTGSYVITLRIDEWRTIAGIRTRVGTVYRDIQVYITN
ncbi:MAG: hypothetical protein MUE81_19485 [Thermoflexibacter sp.]|nr:hypothetical protein [Thermoflexibacter sp.]